MIRKKRVESQFKSIKKKKQNKCGDFNSTDFLNCPRSKSGRVNILFGWLELRALPGNLAKNTTKNIGDYHNEIFCIISYNLI